MIVFCTIGFASLLWYLIAQIETYIFWYFVVKLHKEGLIIKTLPMLFVRQIVTNIFCETKGFNWVWGINFVTRALPWLALGYYIHSFSQEKIKK